MERPEPDIEPTEGGGVLAPLIAAKIVCCGGLLAASGAVSLGGLATLIANPAAKIGGFVVILLAIGWLARRWPR